jgi:hypothetical protein
MTTTYPCKEALQKIAEQDDVELSLDPQWAKRVAVDALSTLEKMGGDPTPGSNSGLPDDAMHQAAHDNFMKHIYDRLAAEGGGNFAVDVIRLVEQAVQYAPPSSNVVVKPLVWEMLPPPYATAPRRPTANTIVGTYTVVLLVIGDERKETWFAALGERGPSWTQPCRSDDEAKAAAQAHYKMLILSALSATATEGDR